MASSPADAARPTRPADRASRVVRTVARHAFEVVPALVTAWLLLPYVIAHGTREQPATIDLLVYLNAADNLLNGRPLYSVALTGGGLQFIYPPIAAALLVPLTWLSYHAAQLVWTALTVAAQQDVLRRCGVPRGWRLALLGAVLVVAFEPLRTTVGYGQVNTLVMWCVVADLLPDPHRRRRLPRGTLIGLAAAVKLTPLLFVAFAFLIGRRRVAAWAAVSFAALTGVGFLFGASQSWWFWRHLGAYRASGTMYVGNQALSGVAARLVTRSDSGAPGVIVGMALAVVACFWAAWLTRSGRHALAVGVVGVASCLASPLAWTHHYVWGAVVLAGLAAPVPRCWTPPRWLTAGWWAWVLWTSVCLPLALLPYANHVELRYRPWQQVVANLGPILAAGLVVAGIATSNARPPAAGADARSPSLAQG